MINCGYDNKMVRPLNLTDTSNYEERARVSESIIDKYTSLIISREEVILPPNEIVKYVHRFFDLDVNNKSSKGKLPNARKIVAYLLYTQHGMGLSEIALLINKNHATIYHSLIKVSDNTVKFDKTLLSQINRVKKSLNINRKFNYK